MTNKEILHTARAEQGGDAFAGIDSYKVKTLPPGTRLVKLEPSGSGYFIPWEEYLRCRRDATQLSINCQLAPKDIRSNPKMGYEYTYRENASLFITTREIKVAEGPTLKNPQYGRGGAIQIHLAGYNRDDAAHNLSLGIKKTHDLKLKNSGLDTRMAEAIKDKRDIYINSRNYHATLSQAEELRRLRGQLTFPGQIRTCDARLAELEKIGKAYENRIEHSTNLFKARYPELPPPTAPTYEKCLRYQERLAAAPDKTLVFNPRLERQSQELCQHLVAKVDDTARKVISGVWKPGECDREVKIDEVRKIYETDHFVKRATCQQQLITTNGRIRQLEAAIGQIDNREKQLLRMGKLMHTLNELRPLADKAESKVLFKKDFATKNGYALGSYHNAKVELEGCGIRTSQDLKIQNEHFTATELGQREQLRQELGLATEQKQTLGAELRGLESRHLDYENFLAMSGKTASLTGSKLSF